MRLVCGLGLVLASLVSLHAARTQPRDPAQEGPIIEQLRAQAPSAVEDFVAGTAAFDADDYTTAETRYRRVLAAASDFDPALRRLGYALGQLDRRQDGRALIEQAVKVNRSMPNLISLATFLAYPKTGSASDSERNEAYALARECMRTPEGAKDIQVLATVAQLSLQRDDKTEAQEAIRALVAHHPNEPASRYYAAISAALDEDWIRADDEIKLAGRLGLASETVARFRDSGVGTRALAWRLVYGFLWTVALWAVGLGLLYVSGFALSKATLRQIEISDPAVPVNPSELRLRKIYRAVINCAGVYYYLSLPIVALLVVGLSGAILFAFLSAGTIPIKLTLLLVIGMFATIWAMGRSLFLKVKAEDPGRPLPRTEAPGLWQLAEEVAAKLQTRPIDEIRLTVGTDLCVYERGTWREKMQDRAQRVLVIGAAVLNDFKLDAFRSVLAHEYGHFANRDTAGGDIALRVQNDMMKFFIAMVNAGQNSVLNVAFHFLRFYDFLFRRVSHGATRLQEVLADRVAAQAFGPAAFEGGLTHVIRASVAFNARADVEVEAARTAKRPLRNLYDDSVVAPSLIVEKNLADLINRPTTDDDTHPGPQDRFRLVRRVPFSGPAEFPGEVWSLFSNQQAIVDEMMAQVQKNVARHYDLG